MLLMAWSRKRGNSYLITVSDGYDLEGNQRKKTKTWKPDPAWNEKRIQKELQKAEVEFEKAVKTGHYADGQMRLEEFAAFWMKEHAEKNLRLKTVARYKVLLSRIIPALGHMKLEQIQPLHLMEFYNNLAEVGIKQSGTIHPKIDLDQKRKDMGYTKTALAEKAGVSYFVIDNLCHGKNVRDKVKAEAVAKALKTTYKKAFEEIKTGETLASSTVAQHHRVLHTMFDFAVQWGYMVDNPCNRVKSPKVTTKKSVTLSMEETARMFECLETEPHERKTAVVTLIYCGLRKGELCGLKWSDIDFEAGTLSVNRALKYLSGVGVYEEAPKTENGIRTITMPSPVVSLLKEHRKNQKETRLKLGDRWKDTGYVFTKWDGDTMHPDSLYQWFKNFIKKNNLPNVTLHELRHTNASMMIASGVDIATVSKRLGHADTSITTRIYTHAIKERDAVASELLEKMIPYPEKAVAK